MALIEFTKRDLLMGKVVTPAWYTMRIDLIGEGLSKDKQSTNYPCTGIIIRNADDGSVEYEGVPVTWNFNSKAIGFARGFLEVLGVTPELGKRYELKAAEGQILDVYVENDTWDGRLVNRVNHNYRATKQ